MSELLGTTSLKLSEGFPRPVPRLGVVYGTWAALGIVGVVAIGTVVFDRPIDLPGAVGILRIIIGVYCVTVLSETSAH
nr:MULTISPECIES: SMR family transporter [Haloarcula]